MRKLNLLFTVVLFFALGVRSLAYSNNKISYRDSITAYNQINKIVDRLNMNDIIIKVNYVNLKKGNTTRIKVIGYTYIKNNIYYISIRRNLNLVDLKIIVSHEMIHVWQIWKGTLKVYPNGWYWRNKFIPINTPYDEQPHEIDAKIMEKFFIEF